jgi:hypothetical protein
MDDEVRVADTEEEIRKMTTIQSEFAEWSGMRFGIHKCAYWSREFVRGRGEDVELANFHLCGEAIPQLAGYKAFKYLGEHKAPASAKTNQSHRYRGARTTNGRRHTKVSGPSPNLRRG